MKKRWKRAMASLLAAAMCFSSYSAVPPADAAADALSPGTYEAEDLTLTGVGGSTTGGSLFDVSGYSGDGFVDLIYNGVITAEINVDEPGMYEISARIVSQGYNNNNGLRGSIEVNGKNYWNSWQCSSTWKDTTLAYCYLEQGVNTILLSGVSTPMYCDTVTVTKADLPTLSGDSTTSDPDATEETKRLMEYLSSVYGEHIIAGQISETQTELDYLYNLTGKYPALRNWSSYAVYPDCKGNGISSSRAEQVVDWVKEKNGISVIDLEIWVPIDFESYVLGEEVVWYDELTAYTNTTFSVSNAVIEGTRENEYLDASLAGIAEFLLMLQAEDVPVVLEMFDEPDCNGGMDPDSIIYWWSMEGPEAYRDLWKYVHTEMRETYGVHNVIWSNTMHCYLPSTSEWYVGNEYVDIVGCERNSSNIQHYAYTNPFYELHEYIGGDAMIALSYNQSVPSLDGLVNEKAGWLWFCTSNDRGDGSEYLTGENFQDPAVLKELYQSDYCITLDELPADLYGEPEPTILNGTLIKDLTVPYNGYSSDWSIDSDIQPNDPIFTDRDIVYTSIPDSLAGAEHITTACDSKFASGTLATFTADANIEVYIAMDTRVTTLPSWLDEWTATGLTATSSNDATFELYKKSFASGETVTLGENGLSYGCVGYTVFVTEQPVEIPTEPPTEAPTEAPTEPPTEKPTEAPTEPPTEKPTEAPTEPPTEAPTQAPTEPFEFTWGEDNWNFNNTSSGGTFPGPNHLAMISKDYLELLASNLTNTEYNAVFVGSSHGPSRLTKPWLGSCYGMAATTLLSSNGLFPYDEFLSGADCLNDMPMPKDDLDISSVISYYQLLQVKGVIQQQYRNVPRQSHKTNITAILNALDTYPTVLVGYEKDGWGGHAVLAYDYAYGSWTYNSKTYDGCIYICDPNSSAMYNEKYNIYFDSSTYEWCIPNYSYVKLSSENGAVFNYVGGKVSEINKGGCLSGVSGAPVVSFIARIDAAALAENHTVEKVVAVSGDEYLTQNSAPGDIIADYSYIVGGESEGVFGYNLADADAAYRIAQEDAEPLQLTMDYGDSTMYASSDAGTEIVFDNEGTVKVTGTADGCVAGMVWDSNYTTSWFALEANGRSAESMTLEMTDNGYVLEADSLKNVKVTANNRENTASVTFSTDATAVLLYQIDETTIGVAIDADGNGTFETKIVDSTKTVCGDVNIDGSVTILDVIGLSKALMGCEPLEEQSALNADVDADTVPTSTDALTIMKYLVKIVEKL